MTALRLLDCSQLPFQDPSSGHQVRTQQLVLSYLAAVCAMEAPVLCAIGMACTPRRSSALHCRLLMDSELLGFSQMLLLLLAGLLTCSGPGPPCTGAGAPTGDAVSSGPLPAAALC